MSKHTPAPWYIDGTIRGTDLIVSNNDYQIAICITHPNPESNKANARLISAAPDGLAAAIKALDECCDLIGTPAGDALQAFINKATGE